MSLTTIRSIDLVKKIEDYCKGSSQEMQRFLVVTVVNIFNHQTVLYIARNFWDWPSTNANLLAAALASIPAFIMSKFWVWKANETNNSFNEILLFWGVTVLGAIISTLAVYVGEFISSVALWIQLCSFGGYFINWIMKFVLLNKVFGKKPKKA